MSRTTIIPLIPGQIDIVTSKGEYNFQEVLDDFPNAETIFVTTYIGSANFSDESDQSRETGFLVRGQDLVRVISENLLPILIDEGIPYFGSMLDDKKILLSFLLSRLEGSTSVMRDGQFTFVGHPLEDQEVYNIHDPFLRKSDLEGLLEVLDEIEGELDNEFREVAGLEHVADLIDIDSINAIRALCDYDTPIHELAEFDSVEYASDILSEQMVHNEDIIISHFN